MFVAGAEINEEELEVFSQLLEESCGLSLGKEKAYLFDSRLAQLMFELECDSFSELYQAIKDPTSPKILERVIDLMTTQETMWFRDRAPWTELETRVLPELAKRAKSQGRRLRAWSCACSTGQEPYSLAMLLNESPLLDTKQLCVGNDAEIVASDVSGAALEVAQRASYGRMAMHRGNLSTARRERYFSREKNTWKLEKQMSRLVQFKKFNLKDSFSKLGFFDLILCRNVLVYFSREFRKAVLAGLAKLLRPGAYLFLGAGEGIYGDSELFEVVEGDDCIYYTCQGS